MRACVRACLLACVRACVYILGTEAFSSPTHNETVFVVVFFFLRGAARFGIYVCLLKTTPTLRPFFPSC